MDCYIICINEFTLELENTVKKERFAGDSTIQDVPVEKVSKN